VQLQTQTAFRIHNRFSKERLAKIRAVVFKRTNIQLRTCSVIVSTIMTIYYFNSMLLYRLNSITLFTSKTVVPRRTSIFPILDVLHLCKYAISYKCCGRNANISLLSSSSSSSSLSLPSHRRRRRYRNLYSLKS